MGRSHTLHIWGSTFTNSVTSMKQICKKRKLFVKTLQASYIRNKIQKKKKEKLAE